jgi:site-specific recombinase XerD
MKSASETSEHISVDPTAVVATDPWQGISRDVIRRFLDVLCTEHGLPQSVLSAYLADLDALDRWLMETKNRTLVTATGDDVREYISVSLSCFRAFYGFLVNAGCRDDDPTEPSRGPRRELSLRKDREH